MNGEHVSSWKYEMREEQEQFQMCQKDHIPGCRFFRSAECKGTAGNSVLERLLFPLTVTGKSQRRRCKTGLWLAGQANKIRPQSSIWGARGPRFFENMRHF